MSDDNRPNDFLNKRKFSRIKLLDPIRLLTSEYSFEEYMGNISKTGCMIWGLKEVEAGEELKVAINSPEQGYINFDCVVRRCIEKDLEDIEAEDREIKDLLFVDDDPEINQTLTTGLEEEFTVEQAFNSEEAKELLK